MILDILIISLIGALLSLDRTAFLQSMIAQPIITAPIIGAVLGDISTGITIGAALQLLWVCTLPVGSYIPPDENLAATLITACTVLGLRVVGRVDTTSYAVLNILLLIPLAYLGSVVDVWIRNINITLTHAADKDRDEFKFYRVEYKNVFGLITFYLINFAVLFVLLSLTVNLIPQIYEMLPLIFKSALTIIYPIFLVVGVATLLFNNRIKNSLTIFTISFVLFSIVFEIL